MYSVKRNISPKEAVSESLRTHKWVGSVRFLHANKYKKDRELWIAGVFGSIIEETDKKSYFINMIDDKEGTPDFILSHTNSEAFNSEVVKCEIKEAHKRRFSNITKESLPFKISEYIGEKVKNRDYKELVLIFYLNFMGQLDIHKLASLVRAKQVDTRELWVLFASNTTPKPSLILQSLLPEIRQLVFDYESFSKL
jgi:hypothetical protein